MKVRYTVVDGEVLSELRGGVKRDYVPDPLGSTVALLDSSQNITDTFSYWPYGESAGRTGTTTTPFQYVGTVGYYTDSVVRNYVRARYLDKIKGRWITEDPSIFGSNKDIDIYSKNRPTVYRDRSGLEPDCIRQTEQPKIPCPIEVGNAKNEICRKLRENSDKLIEPIHVSGPNHRNCLLNWCNQGNIYCHPSTVPGCKGGNSCGFSCEVPGGGRQFPDFGIGLCFPEVINPGCKQTKCKSDLNGTILHEMNGVCGVHHQKGGGKKDLCDAYAAIQCPVLGL